MGFVKDMVPWEGGKISSRVHCLRANNSSPMTYVGTNTYIVAEPTSPGCIVIDPAPSGQHVKDIVDYCVNEGLRVGAIVLSHCHADHTEGAAELQSMTAAEIFAPFDSTLLEGTFEPIENGPSFEVIALPGHSSDSVGLYYAADNSIFIGDIAFRHGPTVVYYPDGVLRDYMESLDKLEALVKKRNIQVMLPGHGYPITDPVVCLEASRAHRLERLRQIKDALANGVPRDAEALVDTIYVDTDPKLKSVAIKSVKAQLLYLDDKEEKKDQ